MSGVTANSPRASSAKLSFLAADHPQPRAGGGELRVEETRRGGDQRVGGGGDGRTRAWRAAAACDQLGHAARRGLGRLLPFGRAVISVDIAFLMRAGLQAQPDIVLRPTAFSVSGGRRWWRTRPAARPRACPSAISP
jgi:hypothetical protein